MSRWFPERAVLRLSNVTSPDHAAKSAAPRTRGLEETLAAFDRELEDRRLARGTRLLCVLSGALVRYRIVPWNADVRGPPMRQLFAEHCYKETYGEIANEWVVRMGDARYARPSLACAIDKRLLESLAVSAHSRGLVLSSLQPSLMWGFNAARSHLKPPSFWYVLPEPPMVSLLLVVESVPVLVKVLAADLSDLERLLQRQSFALGLDATPCPVFVDHEGSASPLPELRAA